MRSRGLLEVTGARGRAAIEPYFMVDGARLQIHNPTWEVIEYWVPVAHMTADKLEATIT